MSNADLSQYEDLRDLGMLTTDNLLVTYEYDESALSKVHTHVTKELERARKDLVKEQDRASGQVIYYDDTAIKKAKRARQVADSAGAALDRYQAQHPELDAPGASVDPALSEVVGENRRLRDIFFAAEAAYAEAEELAQEGAFLSGSTRSPGHRDQLATAVANLDYAASVAFEARQRAKRHELEMKARNLANAR